MMLKRGIIPIIIACIIYMQPSLGLAENWEYLYTSDYGGDIYLDWDSTWYDNSTYQGGTIFKQINPENHGYVDFTTAHLDYANNPWRIIWTRVVIYDSSGNYDGELFDYQKLHYANYRTTDYYIMLKVRKHFGY